MQLQGAQSSERVWFRPGFPDNLRQNVLLKLRLVLLLKLGEGAPTELKFWWCYFRSEHAYDFSFGEQPLSHFLRRRWPLASRMFPR